jgi:hypothetical protein
MNKLIETPIDFYVPQFARTGRTLTTLAPATRNLRIMKFLFHPFAMA